MSDFNKIFTTSNIEVIETPLAILCFNDGKTLSRTKYGLENNMLSLLTDSTRTVSIFYDNNQETRSYEFTSSLTEDNTVLPAIDDNKIEVQNLIKDNLLVFIEGELEPVDNYEVVDGRLVIKYKKESAIRHEYKIIVYSSLTAFQRIINPSFVSTDNEEYILESFYDPNDTLVFVNGEKVDFNCITYDPAYNYKYIIDDQSYYRSIKAICLQISESLDEIYSVEIIRLNNSKSLNFTTTQGYVSYGPYDDFYHKIPEFYDITFKFNDQLKLLVDDIRQGFIIKEVDGFGEAIVVDTTFETNVLHGLKVQSFKLGSYGKNDYYFEVPHYTVIAKYLSEFDTKYQFLPEILTIFQRLLLDEIQDTIQRLRDSRSIQKVDSTQINSLLKLLGFNLNAKNLTKKQRRELIEELNEFYRRLGTRNSYNLLNILQNDLKLINIEQLFTPYGITDKENPKTLYNYYATASVGGSGYERGDYLRAITENNIPIDLLVTNRNNSGSITGVSLITPSDYTILAGDNLALSPILNGKLSVKSEAIQYNYTHTISSVVSDINRYHVGDTLYTSDKRFTITVTGVDSNGKITTSTLSPSSGSSKINITNSKIDDISGAVRIAITSTKIDEPELVASYNYADLNGGEFSINLPQGMYYFEMSGGGGSGGSGDSEVGICGDIASTAGYDGELIRQSFNLTTSTTISGKLGQGGGKTKAVYGATQDYQRGNGWDNGKLGNGITGHLYGIKWFKKNSRTMSKYRWALKAGAGGGSSHIQIGNSLSYTAKGGNGGSAGGGYPVNNYWAYENTATYPYVAGGNGGSGGINGGGGAKGGYSAYNRGDFISGDGEDGYIRIYRYNASYKGTISGNTTPLTDGQVIRNVVVNNKTFTATVHKGLATTVTLSPQTGPEYVNGSTQLDIGKSATVSINSVPTTYRYVTQLAEVPNTYLKNGDVFYNTDGAPFTATISDVNRAEGTYKVTYSPTTGSNEITINNATAYYRTGTGGKLTIYSVESSTQDLADRCYVDFYTRTDLAGEDAHKKEYRIDLINYGKITEGTPKSPRWWLPGGEPDIDYGTIAEPKEDDKDYGYIRDKIHGEWVEWWEWDRKGIWYPTNHVIAEIKMPTDTKFDEFRDTFVEQFYGLASTVVYLHGIIESFYFGSDTTNNSASDTDETNKNFGIAVGAPIMSYEFTVTSNPHRQYKEYQPDEVTLTIIPTPANATVTMVSGERSITQTGTCSLTVPVGNYITWHVEKSGYVSRTVKRHMTADATKRVVLEANYVPVTI